MNLLWSRIYDLILKSLISVEPHIINGIKNSSVRNNCFELYGFDIIIDEYLKPWILEVNLSPSLSADSALDYVTKSNLITDTFNLVGIRKFDRR